MNTTVWRKLSSRLGLNIEGDETRRFRKARITMLALLANRALNIGVKFAIIPLSLSVLGREFYGAWLILLSFASWFNMSDAGMSSALMNHLSGAIGRDDRAAIKSLVSTGTILLTVIGLVISAVGILAVFVAPVEQVLGLRDISFQLDIRLTAALLLTVNIGFLSRRLPDVILSSKQQGYWGALSDSIEQLAALISVTILYFQSDRLIALVGGQPLVWFALAVTIPPAIGDASLWILVWKRFGHDFVPSIGAFSRPILRVVFRDGWAFFTGMWGELLVIQTPIIVIGQALGASAVPLFAIPYQLFFSAYAAINMIATPVWPAIAEANAVNDRAWISRSFQRILKESMALACVAFCILAIASPFIIKHWVGFQYVPSWPFVFALACLFIQWTWNYVFVVLLTALGFIWFRVLSVIAFGILNVILDILLIRRFDVFGVAVGMNLAMLLTQTWGLLFIVHRYCKWAIHKKAV